jgi:hypothetical protein
MRHASFLEIAQCVVVFPLLLLSLAALTLAYRRAWELWKAESPTIKRLLVGSLVLAAVVRWFLAPKLIATLFIGYRWTQQCIDLFPISHYGAASQGFYHILFRIMPWDHVWLMWVNSVIGVFTIPLIATYGFCLLRDARAGVLTAWMVALMPLFIRNDNSDANNIPLLWWLFGGFVLWEAFVSEDDRKAFWGSLVLLCLAMIARPEALGLVPLLAIFSTWVYRPAVPVLRRSGVWKGLLAVAVLAVPHLFHLFHSIRALSSRSSLPGLDIVERLRQLPYTVRNVCVITNPAFFPLSLQILVLIALFFYRGRKVRAHVFLVGASIVAALAYLPDLDYANVARVHVPSALLATILAASGCSHLMRKTPPWAGYVLLVAVFLPFIPTWNVIYAPTNEAEEERLIDEIIAYLPKDEPFGLIMISNEDRRRFYDEKGFTHGHFPWYQLEYPYGMGRRLDVGGVLDEGLPDMETWFFQGVRCYACFRPVSEPPPEGDQFHPACALMHERFDLEPVLERTIPNRGDVWIDYYGDVETLHLALYRVRKKPVAD